MPVVQPNTVNFTALNAPGVYVQLIPPQEQLSPGIPTNILGVVGIASWGPVNSAVTASNAQEIVSAFGSPQVLKYDLVTSALIAFQQGANNFRLVRVTDGTDVAASKAILDTAGSPATGMTVTAKYTGTVGNTIQVTIADGAQSGTYKVLIGRPGVYAEEFDNISGSGATLWQNMVNAINNGISGATGPSSMAVASIGVGTAVPNKTSYTLTGGTNGNTTITSAVLIGDDTTTPRKGMYALRTVVSGAVVILADADDSTKWATQLVFGQQEGCYMALTGPAGQSVDTAISAKVSAGIDGYPTKLMAGDWCYWYDATNQQNRLVSAIPFIAGRLANLGPEQSSLNKQISGIVATQKSAANQVYSAADIVKLSQAGIDVIAKNPSLGNYFAAQTGLNTSSVLLTSGDEYTRLTNFIAYSLENLSIKYIGQLQTEQVRASARAAIQSFLRQMELNGQIGDVNGGKAFQVILDETNNPSNQVALGIMRADVQVAYLRVIRVFLINLQGGQVTVTVQGQ